MDVMDSLLEVECVSESSSKSDDCGLVHVEDVELLVLLVLGVMLDELGAEGTFGVTVVSGTICGPLMAVRCDSISPFHGTSDDNGFVMRGFGTEMFVADGLVMMVFSLAGNGLVRWLQIGFS